MVAAPCARLQLVRGPVRKCGRGRPFNTIVRGHPMSHQCSFCGLGDTPERKLIAGPGVFICSDCVRLASETIAALELEPRVRCAICHDEGNPADHLIFEGRGQLCAACARAVREATDSLVK